VLVLRENTKYLVIRPGRQQNIEREVDISEVSFTFKVFAC
jgi:hypothetical protein